MEDQIKKSAREYAIKRVKTSLFAINALGGILLITLIVSRMGSGTAGQNHVDETTNPIEEYAASLVPEEGQSPVDEVTNPIEEYAASPVPEEGQSPVDEVINPIEKDVASSIPEEGIDIWFAEFGQDYNEFEYVYCDIDMDGFKDILIQSQNDSEVVVDIYIMNWDSWEEEYHYSKANSLAHVGDWQWYAVEGEGLYAVVLYEDWQYIFRVTKYDSYVETEYISYGELRGDPAVYENPLSFMQY